MQILYKLLATLVASLLVTSDALSQTNSRFGKWSISHTSSADKEFHWAPFIWTNDSFGNRYFERTAMFIPTSIEGLPYTFLFQFDLGADITQLYGHPLQALLSKHTEFHRIRNYKSAWQFWNLQTAFKDLTLYFGDTKATAKNCFIRPGFGEQLSLHQLTDSSTIKLGTIGADLFQHKILVLDYPNQRFAVCDSLPYSLQVSFVKMSLDAHGRAIIPLQLKNRSYRVLFDNGSSIFPLLVSDDKASSFSTAMSTDTISIWSWGMQHNVIGRPLKDSFQLAGRSFSNTMVYADYRKSARTNIYDAIAGNALFWDKVVIIDFKNKKFGVVETGPTLLNTQSN